jgi:hypothetical protein
VDILLLYVRIYLSISFLTKSTSSYTSNRIELRVPVQVSLFIYVPIILGSLNLSPPSLRKEGGTSGMRCGVGRFVNSRV